MKRLTKTARKLVLLAFMLCAGCVTAGQYRRNHHYADYVDVSDVANGSVATIRGREKSLGGLAGEWCWLEAPGIARRVTVNAGVVDVVAVCAGGDAVMEERWLYSAAFHFDAVAGHEYEFDGFCNDCLRLRDITTEEIVAESPYLQVGEFVEDLSTSDHTATIMQRQCWLTDGEATSLIVDAGPISMDVTCRLFGWINWQKRATASFDFDAEAGHTYMISESGDECIGLSDITESTFRRAPLISCEPYEKVE